MNIHRDDMKPIGFDYPMPTTAGYDANLSFSQTFSSPNATTARLVKAGTTSKSIYITDIIASCSSALWVQLLDEDGTAVTERINIAANTPFSHAFKTALPVTEAKALMCKTSIAAEIHLLVNGYIR